MPGCLLLNHTNKEMELIDDLFEDYVDSFCDVFVGIIPQERDFQIPSKI